MQLDSQKQALEKERDVLVKELEVMRARGVDNEPLLERVTREHEARVENMQAEIEDLKKELCVYRDQCEALEEEAGELREQLRSQAAEAALEKGELESTIQEVEDSLGELNTLLTEKLSNYLDKADDDNHDHDHDHDEGAIANA
jgi:chromosome segregation ATPase